MIRANDTRARVARYYGKDLRDRNDLKAGACCPGAAPPPRIQAVIDEIEPEVRDRFYGCGSPIPPLLSGCTILDLGCGTGRDTFIAARLAGPEGRVIGVDMTEEQLDVAKRNLDRQMARFGYARPTVEFRLGYMEDLGRIGIRERSVDVVISNCVINLSPDKERVFYEIHRVLKPGGELYFADVFADRRVPPEIREDPVLYAECLGGTLYVEDFRRIMEAVGFLDHRWVSHRPVRLENPVLEEKAGSVNFLSITVRAFKLAGLEDRCEDYGQVATYRGTIPDHPHRFLLDEAHVFETERPERVCGNTAAMLRDTRYAPHFQVQGGRERHFGLFAGCGTAVRPVPEESPHAEGGCC